MYTLERRDDFLCIKETLISPCDPVQIVNYWNVMPYHEFLSGFSSEERAQRHLGSTVSPLLHPPIHFKDSNNRHYTIPHRDLSTQPPATHTETTPIEEPRQRGRKLPLQWHNGKWYKVTTKGLKQCE